MNTRFLRFLPVLILLLSTAACGKPTYSKEKIEESIINLCKDEYKLGVQVKIIGSTLGVFIPIEGLIDQDFKLNTDAGEKIEDVALSIHRVIMSTDRPLKLYTLTARDTKTRAAEFVLTGATYDVVRVRLLDISRGEYHKRILRTFRFHPAVIGEERIKGLFDTLNVNPSAVQSVKSIFYPIYVIGKKDSQKIEIVDMLSKEISEQEALFYIKTKEYYDPLPELEGRTVLLNVFHQGFTNEYLILTNISMLPNPIKEIVPKYFYSGTEIRQRNLKDTFEGYNDTGYIGIDGFPKKDLGDGWFLAQQIAGRIKILFKEDKYLKEKFNIEISQGSIDNKIFRLKFAADPSPTEKKDTEIIFPKILKLAGGIFHRYDFEDFEGIELTDITPGGKKVFLSKHDLERFRMGRLKIQDVMTNDKIQSTK